jgi:surfactin synthase thioesterase subunit
VWGRGDEIFGPAGAQAFAEDLPDAEIHLLDGGHFLLESALDEVTGLVRAFLAKVHPDYLRTRSAKIRVEDPIIDRAGALA